MKPWYLASRLVSRSCWEIRSQRQVGDWKWHCYHNRSGELAVWCCDRCVSGVTACSPYLYHWQRQPASKSEIGMFNLHSWASQDIASNVAPNIAPNINPKHCTKQPFLWLVFMLKSHGKLAVGGNITIISMQQLGFWGLTISQLCVDVFWFNLFDFDVERFYNYSILSGIRSEKHQVKIRKNFREVTLWCQSQTLCSLQGTDTQCLDLHYLTS